MPISERELRREIDPTSPGGLPPICPECGYNLTGLTSSRCPECGNPFVRSAVKKASQELVSVTARLAGWKQRVLLGLYFGLGGAAALAGALLSPGAAGGMLRIIALFAGFIGLGLGLSVLIVYKYPIWVRQQLSPPPDMALGLGVGLLGLAVGVIAVVL